MSRCNDINTDSIAVISYPGPGATGQGNIRKAEMDKLRAEFQNKIMGNKISRKSTSEVPPQSSTIQVPVCHLRSNAHQVHRRYNLPNSALNRVAEVVLSARLKHAHAVAGPWGATHDRLRQFQAVGFGHHLAIPIVIAPTVEVNRLFVCCPGLWWNYLGS